MLEAREVSVSIGNKRIVSSTSFTAAPGQVTVIVGPNGSGKTTLLKAMSGDLAYEGEILINGFDVASTSPWQLAQMRAILPQATTLAFPFTVGEIVRLGILGGRSSTPDPDQERLPERALAAVDLDGFAGRLYQELSGGEQQRVQLARVLCQVWVPVLTGLPRYLFLDEPVSSLDIKHQLAIMRIARSFAARGGGVVAILHDLNLTAMFADSVLVMHGGRGMVAGAPSAALRDDVLKQAFGCSLRVGALPPAGTPFVLPQSADEG